MVILTLEEKQKLIVGAYTEFKDRVRTDSKNKTMCYSFYKAIKSLEHKKEIPSIYNSNIYIGRIVQIQIPEFDPLYLNYTSWIDPINPFKSYWWDAEDTESRIKAFETLMGIYGIIIK